MFNFCCCAIAKAPVENTVVIWYTQLAEYSVDACLGDGGELLGAQAQALLPLSLLGLQSGLGVRDETLVVGDLGLQGGLLVLGLGQGQLASAT